jgi:hypothetical protein
MESLKFKTKRQFIEEIGLSKSSFYRLVRKKKVDIYPELLSPAEEAKLRKALGLTPQSPSEQARGTD